MDITGLIDSMRQDLTRASALGGEEGRAAAERLALALEPALRLTLIEALAQAAAEISEAIPGVVIDVTLRSREPAFLVSGTPAAEPPGAAFESAFETDDDEQLARITLRLPEALKGRAEALAARRGQSLNTWLVAAARAAAGQDPSPGQGRYGKPGRRVQGWAR
jgi:hypothetical protein